MRRTTKAAGHGRRETEGPTRAFERAANSVHSVDSITNLIERGRALARNAAVHGEAVGLSRIFGVPETACLAAIAHGMRHLYTIANFYRAPASSMHTILKRLVKGELIEPHGSVNGKFELVDGRFRMTYRLTPVGKQVLKIMEGAEDRILAYYDHLLEQA